MALTTVPASLSATALTLTTAAQPNITSVGTLTGLTVSGNIAGTLTTAAQTNITSVGTLTGLAVGGTIQSTSEIRNIGSSGNANNRLKFSYDSTNGNALIGPDSNGGNTTLALGTSNSGTYANALTIGNTGTVTFSGAIVTTTPSTFRGGTTDYAIEVHSSDAYTGIRFTDPDRSGNLFYRGAANHMYLHDSSFSVAGQTLASGYKFQVNGDSNFTGEITSSSTVTAQKLVSTNGVLELDDNGSHNGIINSPASLRINFDSDGNSTGESFQVGSNATNIDSNNIHFIVKEDGLVGINDTAPDRKLSIIGDSTTNGQYPLSLDATNTDYVLEFKRSGTSEWWIKASSSNFTVHENGVGDHFRISAGGNVGIGVTPPAHSGLGEILSVNTGNLIGVGTSGAYLGYNMYYNSGNWKYQVAAASAILTFAASGDFSLRQATTGSAGGTISYSETLKVNRSTGYIDATGSSQVRLTLGSTGTPGTNTANWIRGNSSLLEFNSASSGFNWEVGGNQKMKLNSSGNLAIGAGHDETRRGLGVKGSSPGIHFVDSDVTNLRHEIVGGGNAGLELSADYLNVGTGYIRFDIGGTNYHQFHEGGSTMHRHASTQQGRHYFVGTISAWSNGNRYAHVQLSTGGSAMLAVHVFGYSYLNGIIEGIGVGYNYNNANQTAMYNHYETGSVVNMWENTSNSYSEVVIDTVGTATSNRWGAIAIYAAIDLGSSEKLEIVQYAFNASASRLYT